jgi:hypothetical protein
MSHQVNRSRLSCPNGPENRLLCPNGSVEIAFYVSLEISFHPTDTRSEWNKSQVDTILALLYREALSILLHRQVSD